MVYLFPPRGASSVRDIPELPKSGDVERHRSAHDNLVPETPPSFRASALDSDAIRAGTDVMLETIDRWRAEPPWDPSQQAR